MVDLDVQDKLDLPTSLPKWAVADNASNMVKGLNMSVADLYTCCCHTQQLAIGSFLESFSFLFFLFIGDSFKAFKDAGDPESMLDKAEKCKKLAAHIKRAEVSRKLFHKECELSGHHPNAIPVANETRWDSAFTNMKGVLYHKPCLLRLAQQGHLRMEDSEGQIVDLIPSPNDFLIIEAGVEILESCKITTKIFEVEKAPTMPLVVERLYTMDQEFEEFTTNASNRRDKKKAVAFAKVLRTRMNVRFPEFGTDVGQADQLLWEPLESKHKRSPPEVGWKV